MDADIDMIKVASVSVVIPCYCCADVLNRAVKSVLAQTLLPAEIILIDDASPDQNNTKKCINAIVSEYSTKYPTKIRSVFLLNNQGPGVARNVGWNIASEHFVAFLDADDTWANDKLIIQYQWMIANPQYQVTCHDCAVFGSSKYVQSRKIISHRKIYLYGLLIRNISTRSVMLVNKIGYRFPINMRYGEDYFLWLNMASNGIRIVKLKLILAYSFKRGHGVSGLSANLVQMHNGVINSLDYIYNNKKIGSLAYWMAIMWEKNKYTIRAIVKKLVF